MLARNDRQITPSERTSMYILMVDWKLNAKNSDMEWLNSYKPPRIELTIKDIISDPYVRIMHMTVETSVDHVTRAVILVVDYHGSLFKVFFIVPLADPDINHYIDEVDTSKILE